MIKIYIRYKINGLLRDIKNLGKLGTVQMVLYSVSLFYALGFYFYKSFLFSLISLIFLFLGIALGIIIDYKSGKYINWYRMNYKERIKNEDGSEKQSDNRQEANA
jgi:cadmium resistance protein CadD (predicted permease)